MPPARRPAPRRSARPPESHDLGEFEAGGMGSLQALAGGFRGRLTTIAKG